jgi:DNA-binding NarL/FixJ family response regulator
VTPIRVLVIDDDPLQIELVERALSRDGFELRGVSTLAEVTAAAKAFVPNVVLLDINMPQSSPEQVIARIRDAVPGSRIVLYSAWEDSKLRGLASRLGADAFISKSESVFAIGNRLRDVVRG